MLGMRQALLAFTIGLGAAVSSAEAGITITKALVTGGKLVVTGKSTTGSKIKLDGAFTASIKSDDTFKFSLTYLPDDCIVELQVVGSATKKTVIIADCGPKGTPGGKTALLQGAFGVTGGGGGQPTQTTYAFLGATVTLPVAASQRIVIEGASYSAGYAGAGMPITGNLTASYCYKPSTSSVLTTFALVPASNTTAFSGDANTTNTSGSLGFGASAPGAAGDYEIGVCGIYASGGSSNPLFSSVSKVLVHVTE